MGSFAVFNQLEWKPPIRAKLLTAPTLKIDVRFDDVELVQMPDKQRKAFDASFKKFDADFQKLGTQKIKDVQDAVTGTEKIIEAKKTEKERKEVIETADKMLNQAFIVFQNQLESLAQKHYEASLAKSQQVMKQKLQKAKVKAAVKITVVVGLQLTAAGLKIGVAVGVAVASGGTGSIGAAVTTVKTVWSTSQQVYKTVSTNLPTLDNQIALVKADVDKLSAAAAELEKVAQLRSTGATGITDRFKQARAQTVGNLVALDKHVGQLDKYIFSVRKAMREQTDKWAKLADQINANAPGGADLKKKANNLERKTMEASQQLNAIADLKAASVNAQAAFKKNNALDLGPLNSTAKRLMDAAPLLKEVVSAGIDVGSAAGKLVAAVV